LPIIYLDGAITKLNFDTIMPTLKKPHYITDEHGKKKAVQLDLKTYQRLIEAYEDFCDIQTYERTKPITDAQIERGEFLTLSELQATVRERLNRTKKNNGKNNGRK
jgi:hypothetical protein